MRLWGMHPVVGVATPECVHTQQMSGEVVAVLGPMLCVALQGWGEEGRQTSQTPQHLVLPFCSVMGLLFTEKES